MKDNPFGQSITVEDLIDTLGFFDSWEDKYKYIIDLGKELPPLNDALKDEAHLVRGCQSQVWIDFSVEDGKLWFNADSDAFIVKGLLGLVLAAFNNKSPKEVLAFNIEEYFDTLGLMSHLSSTRSNGIRAMVKRVQSIAENQLALA